MLRLMRYCLSLTATFELHPQHVSFLLTACFVLFVQHAEEINALKCEELTWKMKVFLYSDCYLINKRKVCKHLFRLGYLYKTFPPMLRIKLHKLLEALEELVTSSSFFSELEVK